MQSKPLVLRFNVHQLPGVFFLDAAEIEVF